jgi:hypothetical protein
MPRTSKYWLLLERDNEASHWGVSAGDSERATMVYERQVWRDHGTPAKDLMIVGVRSDAQAEIDRLVDDLNGLDPERVRRLKQGMFTIKSVTDRKLSIQKQMAHLRDHATHAVWVPQVQSGEPGEKHLVCDRCGEVFVRRIDHD